MTTHDHRSGQEQQDRPTVSAIDGWVPEDRVPSAAENNFMSFALFAFLILFGVGCMIFL